MVIEWSEYPERIIRTGYKSELDCPKVKQEADRVSYALEILRREQPPTRRCGPESLQACGLDVSRCDR
jgi:hypothetical protein